MTGEGETKMSSEGRSTSMNNVVLGVSVELARKEISVGQLRHIKKEDVIEFEKLAGEAFDVLFNGRKFAEGEVVVVFDQMAIRLTRMIDC